MATTELQEQQIKAAQEKLAELSAVILPALTG